MRIRDLMDIVDKNDIPLDAQILIFSNHGYNMEFATCYQLSTSLVSGNPDDMIWEDDYDEEADGPRVELDEDDLDYEGDYPVTAICLYSY